MSDEIKLSGTWKFEMGEDEKAESPLHRMVALMRAESFAKGRIAGLREAARIASKRKVDMKHQAYNCAVDECVTFILAEAERREEAL